MVEFIQNKQINRKNNTQTKKDIFQKERRTTIEKDI